MAKSSKKGGSSAGSHGFKRTKHGVVLTKPTNTFLTKEQREAFQNLIHVKGYSRRKPIRQKKGKNYS